MSLHAGQGRLDWIGLRTARRAPMEAVEAAEVTETGLVGDRHGAAGKRAVTLIQSEHLPVIASLARRDDIAPAMLRRNLMVSGLNLTALNGRRIAIGAVELQITGPCAPCSRMQEALGPGGYNAVRGHGGWCARVVRSGAFAVGDAVVPPEGTFAEGIST